MCPMLNSFFPQTWRRAATSCNVRACARLSLSPGLSEPVLQVPQLLEDQSDIVSTTEKYHSGILSRGQQAAQAEREGGTSWHSLPSSGF